MGAIRKWIQPHILDGPKKRGNGYFYVKILEPRSGKELWIPYHRYIWEAYYRKPIKKGYVIHHKDRDKENNDIDNLQAMPSGEHYKLHKKEWKNARKSKRRRRRYNRRRPQMSAKPKKYVRRVRKCR